MDDDTWMMIDNYRSSTRKGSEPVRVKTKLSTSESPRASPVALDVRAKKAPELCSLPNALVHRDIKLHFCLVSK